MTPTIRVKSPESEGNPHGFVVINQADFNADEHEAFDPADLEGLKVVEPRVLTTDDLAAARAQLERMHGELMAKGAELDKRAADLDLQANEQEAERQRLAEEAARLAEQNAGGGKLTIAQLRAELTARSIEFDPAASKSDLQALLDAAPPKA